MGDFLVHSVGTGPRRIQVSDVFWLGQSIMKVEPLPLTDTPDYLTDQATRERYEAEAHDSVRVRTMIQFESQWIREACRQHWKESESWLEGGCVPSFPDFEDVGPTEWVPYETYMRAKIHVMGDLGVLWVEFPPEISEDNRLHTHPVSDRIITVMRGSGTFVARRPGGSIIEAPLCVGDRVWMPRGVLHTFKAGPNGLLVESIHNPWIPLDDPKCIVYPDAVE